MIPEAPSPGTESHAELRVFEALRDGTSDAFTAFHHVAWLVPAPHGPPQQGEADFVIAHPRLGAVVLEVKGGAISFDSAKAEWRSRGRAGEFVIKDPFGQARRSSHALKDLLAKASHSTSSPLDVGYTVAFPDTQLGNVMLRPDAPREVVLDADDLAAPADRVASVLRRGGRPPGDTGVALLERVLAKSFNLRAPLAIQLADEQKQLLRLTEDQYRILDMLARQPRVAIAGCAGSGKTFLAAEKARRLAAQGVRVLVLCFNLLLAEHLRRGLSDLESVDVFGFYELCEAIVRESGTPLPRGKGEPDEGPYYGRLYQLFQDKIDTASGRYGALIVDEAQDFRPDWWIPLQLLLEDPDASPLYVFYDDNQRIFPVPEGLPVPTNAMQLTVNCRNTQRINRVVTAYYGGLTIEARGPEGIPVDQHFYTTRRDLLAKLDAEVGKWLRTARVSPGDIALLTPHAIGESALSRVDRLGGVALTDDPWDRTRVLRSSVYRFKGMERLIVAVVELDGASDKLLYIAFSRASVFLSVFCPEAMAHRLPAVLGRKK